MTIYTTGEVDAQALAMLLKERDELRAALKERDDEIEENDQLRDRMSKLLTATANALKGEPHPLTLHDWSDLPKVATEQREDLEQALDALTTVYGLGTETPIIREILEVLKCHAMEDVIWANFLVSARGQSGTGQHPLQLLE